MDEHLRPHIESETLRVFYVCDGYRHINKETDSHTTKIR